jgi:hypothetical protein
MKKLNHVLPIAAGVILFLASSAFAQAPRIFFLDLTSGPNSGGESVGGYSGAYVTIYGDFFGSSQGNSTVTWNGLNCLRVVPPTGSYSGWGSAWLWYQKIVVQLGSGCTPGTGDFVVTVNGVPSVSTVVTINGQQIDNASFTVRSTGNIHFVCATPLPGQSSCSDSNSGTFSSPWRTIDHAVDQGTPTAPGDIIYVENGVSETSGCSQYNGAICPDVTGTASNPIALVTYPGATATIGSTTGQDRGVIMCTGLSGCSNAPNYWTIAGMTLRGNGENSMKVNNGLSHIRIIANDMSCPNANTASGCLETGSPFLTVYGNYSHDNGVNVASSVTKLMHAMYLGDVSGGSASAHTDLGWNLIANNKTDRGIQFYTSTGSASCSGGSLFDIHVHDNVIHDNRGAGIYTTNISVDCGPTEIYNNVIYNAGTGPDFIDGASAWVCIYASAETGTTAFRIYNNTGYNCGYTGGSDPSSGIVGEAGANLNLANNIMVQPSTTFGYLYLNGPTNMSCSNNLFWGSGGAPSNCSNGVVNANPQFVNLSGHDLHLMNTSPAINAGVNIAGLLWDHDGISRPQGGAYDIGAYEYYGAGSRPDPPTNLQATVH